MIIRTLKTIQCLRPGSFVVVLVMAASATSINLSAASTDLCSKDGWNESEKWAWDCIRSGKVANFKDEDDCDQEENNGDYIFNLTHRQIMRIIYK